MNTKRLLPLAALLLSLPVAAQDIYKVENFSGEDLNGTARYVGMGGAMNALGADLSTMSTNPAAIGLFRRSDISMTGSLLIDPNGEKFYSIGKTRASFDQMGIVFALPVNSGSLNYLNFGFNYQKHRNFKNYVGIYGASTKGYSQSDEAADLATYGKWNDGIYVSPIANSAWETMMIDQDSSGKYVGAPYGAQDYDYRRVQHGGIKQYDFNFSMNFNDRVYAGLTFGVHNVDWNSNVAYAERLLDNVGGLHDYYNTNEQELRGNGFDVKFGLIFRPVESSPFRVGLAVSTPTWYNLTARNVVYMNSPFTDSNGNPYSEWTTPSGEFDYRITTPWKFNIALATTVSDWLAVDAEYEYKNYQGASIRYPDNSYRRSYYGSLYPTYKDHALANQIDKYMKSVSTFKIGAEAKIYDGVYLRAGYNYVSKPFSDDAIKDMFPHENTTYAESESVCGETGTDYINLGAINRVTLGLGVRGKHWYGDLGYQFQKQSGDVYPFHMATDASLKNVVDPQKADFNRHQLLLTIGYKF